ncbi:cytochrome P450 [Burkholderia sp. MS455]|uniref:cytochrome P450 n=1 Tax=Burkholderia sp. MS455 TaxID=2811788 RepID=UPI0019588AB5|nr:cytochrome P450 [Burkholderia sp. MS455]QRR07611.1 cytochrome P450 [Burkholderia sp. MS455]
MLEVIADVAQPATATIMLKLIGLDPNLWREYAAPYHDFSFRRVPSDVAARQLYHMSQRLIEDVKRVRQAPIEGTLLADLLQRPFKERPLSDEEIVTIITTLFGAGSETVQASIGTAVVYLGEHPEQRRRLIEEPALIVGAVEEFLRTLAAQPCIARTVTTDYKLGDVQLRKDDKVLLFWAAGNLDADRFPAPFEVDFERHSNPHLSFGAGTHKCLGMHLARIEIATCIEAILELIPDYRLREDELCLARDCSLIFGFERIPIEFQALGSP